MKNLFVFDLDNTLGEKTPTYPNVTPINGKFLKRLSDDPDNLILFATGRPRTQVLLGLRRGGLGYEDVSRIFRGACYEDGLFVQAGDKVVYNAAEEAPAMFKRLKTGFFDNEAAMFFWKNGFPLVRGSRLVEVGNGKCGSFSMQNYDGTQMAGQISFPVSFTPLWQQANDVRETYKAAMGFKGDSLDAQEATFKKVYETATRYLDLRFDGWQEAGKLERWKDAVEIYPRLPGKEEVFIKGEGVVKLLGSIGGVSRNIRTYVCCDGRNDISLVRYLSERFSNCLTVCPSNVSDELKAALEAGNFNYEITEQDCTKFTQGLEKLIV